MNTRASSTADPAGSGHVVRRPRPTDALGQALRGAFGPAAILPDDMRRALDLLDRETRRH